MDGDTELSIDLTTGAAPGVVAGEVPELNEGIHLDLPERAVLLVDGNVQLTFDQPAVITYRPVGGGDPRSEKIEGLLLRRIKGLQVRKIIEARGARSTDLALSFCSGITQAKLSLLYKVMEPGDLLDARKVVSELIGADSEGLPERAEQHDDGSITLPLLFPATDGNGEQHTDLLFKRFKAEALVAMQTAKDILGVGLNRATGLTLKAASGLIDDMDAADVMAVQGVIGFLSGIGRKTGG